MTTLSRTTVIYRGLEEYEVEVEFNVTSWGSPGQYSGPPERCYPAEGPEFDLVAITLHAPSWAQGRYPHNEMPFALTDAENEAIYDWLCMDPPEPDDDPGIDWDDIADRRREDREAERFFDDGVEERF